MYCLMSLMYYFRESHIHSFLYMLQNCFNYMPIEIQPKDKWSRSKCCTEEGDSRGHANFLIFIDTPTPYTQEYLSTKKPKSIKSILKNFDILLGYVTSLILSF